MAEEFSRSGYRALIQAFLERGYLARGYEEARADQKHLILRHDLDMSLQAACPIAEIEHDLGVRGHYFVLLRTEMYNLFSPAGQSSLKDIQKLGHEIGLHFDAAPYVDNLAELDAAAELECRILEDAAGAPVRMISFHRPAKILLGYAKRLGGRRHAYEPSFFSDMGYVSDSRGGWHHGSPLDHEAYKTGRAIQLLTHPVWWTGSADMSPQNKLDRFVDERYELLRSELAANCETYQYDRPGRDSS